ncbi:MAG: protein kinase, partial [Myxococcales bacterium]|nr:protein kinase [Myxococcales bacterium]
VVYLARDPNLNRDVALKIVHLTGVAEHTRFEREAKWLAAIDHPHVVRFVAHGVLRENARFLAMEWLSGETLAERLKRSEPTPAESVRLVWAVARALEALHARGIVHRDLKPSNLMLVDGVPERTKLLDFGVVRSADEGVTEAGALVGTPGYMAPEQIRGGEVSPATDVFGLGCVLYRCLAGRAPFAATHVSGALTRALFGLVDSLAERRPELPEALVELTERALRSAPEARFADGRAMREALEAIDDAALSVALARGGVGDTERHLATWITVEGLPPLRPPDDPDATHAEHDPSREALARELGRFGAVVVHRESTRLHALVEGGADTKDLASIAARAALALRPLFPEAAIALRTGHVDRAPVDDPLADGITLDATTARLLEGAFDVTLHGETWHLEGEADPLRTPPPSLADPFVGRGRELRWLESVVETFDDEGVACAAALVGPAGVGKTRLLRELLGRHPAAHALRAQGNPVARREPLGVVAELARGALGLRATDDADVRRVAVDRWARRNAETTVDDIRVHLGRLVGATPPTEGAAARRFAEVVDDPGRFASAGREAFVALHEVATREAPTWLIVDDAHWVDAASWRALRECVSRLAERPLVVLAAGRSAPEGVTWAQLPLGELSARHATTLVRRLRPTLPDARVEELVGHAHGNALFLRELVHTNPDEAFPESLLALAQTRLSRLSADARRTARALSILEVSTTRPALEALLAAEVDVDEAVAELQAARLLADRELAFASSLMREAAYATLSDEDRRLGHRLAAEWLARHGGCSPLHLAEHWSRAERPEEALAHLEKATHEAFAAGDWDATEELVARAKALATEPERVLSLELLAHEALAWNGRHVELVEVGEQLLPRLPRGGEAWSRVAAGLLLAGGNALSTRRAFGLLTEIASSPLPASPTLSHVRAYGWTAAVCWRAGGVSIALPLDDQLTAVLPHLDDPARIGWVEIARLYRSRFYDRDPAAALEHGEHAVLELERSDDRFAVTLALAEVGYERLTLGRPDLAMGRLVDSRELSRRMRVGSIEAYAAAVAGLAASRDGRAEEARERASEAIGLADATKGAIARAYARHLDAIRAVEAHAPAEAIARIDDLRAIGGDLPLPHRPWIDATEARARLGLGERKQALELARRAVAALESHHPPHLAELWILRAHAETSAASATGDGAFAAEAEAAEEALRE